MDHAESLLRAEIALRVRYSETDQMGVVYHANYLPWFEIARTELCRLRGVRYRDIEEQDGLMLAVTEVNCRYHAPARYDDDLIAAGYVKHAHPRMITFGYEVLEARTRKLLATGETKHIFLDRTGKPVKVPDKYWELFGIAKEVLR